MPSRSGIEIQLELQFPEYKYTVGESVFIAWLNTLGTIVERRFRDTRPLNVRMHAPFARLDGWYYRILADDDRGYVQSCKDQDISPMYRMQKGKQWEL